MFEQLVYNWRDRKSAREVGRLVNRFWKFYGKDIHKIAAVTPATHVAEYNPYDRSYLRLMMYPRFKKS
jgi:hypothetical protein